MNALFRTFDTTERKKLAGEGKAMPDGSFPIATRKDVQNAVRDWGRAGSKPAVKAHIKKRAKALGAEDALPDDWRDGDDKDKAKMSIEFSETAEPKEVGGFIVRTGKVFECGDYPDKQFSLSEAEADAAIENFQPVAANIEHNPSLLDGKIGGLTKLWRKGKDLFGEVSVPKWLHEMTGGEPIKPSMEWDRKTKQAAGLAYVLNPRIQTAALMAAFAASEFGDSAAAHQRIHDTAADHGAECPGKPMFSEDIAAFLTPAQLKSLQHHHDHAVDNGASCDLYATRKNGLYSSYSDDTTTTEQARDRAGKGKSPMSLMGKFVAFLRGEGKLTDEEAAQFAKIEATEAQPMATAPALAETAEFKAVKQDLEAARALAVSQQSEITELKAKFTQNEQAARFAADQQTLQKMVRQMKMTPGEAMQWEKIAQESPAAFAAALPALQSRTPLPQIAGKGVSSEAVNSTFAADGDRITALTREKMKAIGSTDYAACFKQVCKENPDLAEAVQSNVMTIAGGDD